MSEAIKSKTIVLISCTKKKQEKPKGQTVAAKDLYTSPLFKKAWRYANLLKPDRIFILSAKHGLLAPDTRIAPYNQTLNQATSAQRKQWAAGVIASLQKEGIDIKRDRIIILAGKSYWQYLVPQLANISLPYVEAGCKGIGHILKWLNEQI